MNSGFFEALSLLGDENSVETEILVEKVKSALLRQSERHIRTVRTISE